MTILIEEAVIKSIEKMPLKEVWKKYGTGLFLARAELVEYARKSPLGKRTSKESMVYILAKVKKYENPNIS